MTEDTSRYGRVYRVWNEDRTAWVDILRLFNVYISAASTDEVGPQGMWVSLKWIDGLTEPNRTYREIEIPTPAGSTATKPLKVYAIEEMYMSNSGQRAFWNFKNEDDNEARINSVIKVKSVTVPTTPDEGVDWDTYKSRLEDGEVNTGVALNFKVTNSFCRANSGQWDYFTLKNENIVEMFTAGREENAIILDPFQIIVNTGWELEEEEEEYYVVNVRWTSNMTAEKGPTGGLPTPDWPRLPTTMYDWYITSLGGEFYPYLIGEESTIQGRPVPETRTFNEWQYAPGGVYTGFPGSYYYGYWPISFDIFDQSFYNVPQLTTGPVRNGEFARDTTTLTVDMYYSPFTGSQLWYPSNLTFGINAWVEVVADYVGAPPYTFSSTLSAQKVKTVTYDFSTWYLPYGDGVSTWRPVGLWAYLRFPDEPLTYTPGGEIGKDSYLFYVLFKKFTPPA
jgi:hypothetical protein